MSSSETDAFEKTLKQVEAIDLLGSAARHVMLYGGSRSGKSFILCYALIVRACKVKSRHVILRLKFNHIKTSIWLDTLPKVLNLCFPHLSYRPNNSDYYIEFPNGSEIWVAGLDDKIRTEKILGKEYSTIFYNECSQIPYSSISIALTRLAEKNALTNKAYYDENPPSKKHWSYWRFIKLFDPDEQRELDGTKHAHLLMNPHDNIQNIDGEYISDILDNLPSRDRQRFKDGDFTESEEGSIYYAFSREKHVRPCEYDKDFPLWAGIDFNVHPMTVSIGQVKRVGSKDVLYIIDEFYLTNSNTPKLSEAMRTKYGTNINVVPDYTGKKRTSNANLSDIQILKSFGFTIKASPNPFRVDRYAAVNGALEQLRVVISPRCKYTIKDLESVTYKEGSDQPDTTDPMLTHCSDNLGYLIYKTVNPLRGSIKKIGSQTR